MNKRKYIVPLIFLVLFCVQNSLLGAEEFSVFQAFCGLEDTSKLEVQDYLKVDLSESKSEAEKIKKIAEAVIRRELEGAGEEKHSTVVFVPIYINKRQDGTWFVNYSWEYLSNLEEEDELPRYFFIKIDLKNKTIYHTRSRDSQFTGP